MSTISENFEITYVSGISRYRYWEPLTIIKCAASLQSSFIDLHADCWHVTSRNHLIYAPFSKLLVNKTSLPSMDVSHVTRSVHQWQERKPSHHWSVGVEVLCVKADYHSCCQSFVYHCFSLSARLTLIIRKAKYCGTYKWLHCVRQVTTCEEISQYDFM